MTVPSLRPLVAAALLGLLTTSAAACGEEERPRSGMLAQSRAQSIKSSLADVQEAVRDGSCTRVDEELRGLRTKLEQLPQRTDDELRARLDEGARRLEEQAPSECDANQPETTPKTTPETTPEAVPETVPTEPPPAETTPTQPPPVTTPATPGTGQDGEGGAGGREETPGHGNGTPPVTPPGQDDSGGEEAPGVTTG